MALKNIPQAERLLSGTLTSYLSDVATTCVMSDPPSKFPTYIDLEPDSTTKKELIRAVAVSGSTVTIERSVNGVVTDHAANATYKQKITSRHWDAVSDALEKGYLMEDALRVIIRVSDTQFTITGYGASDDLTGTYTIGRVLRINSSASYVMTVTSSSYSAGTNKTTIDVSATLPTPVSTVEFGIAPLGGTNLPLTSPVLTTPKVVTSINDANGNEVIKTPATASAVNEVTVTNSATGNSPSVSATGGDDNLDLLLVAKGTGVVKAGGTAVSTAVKASGAEITTGTDDAKFATAKALADATVGKLGAAWTAFDPTIANLTVGSGGTKSGYYMQIGKTVFFRVYVKLGTSSSVGALDLTLPVTSIAYPELVKLADVTVLDSGAAYISCVMLSDTTFYAPNVSATYITHTTFSSTVPMTWTTNDALSITGFYEAA